jgi:hypothetical protein
MARFIRILSGMARESQGKGEEKASENGAMGALGPGPGTGAA